MEPATAHGNHRSSDEPQRRARFPPHRPDRPRREAAAAAAWVAVAVARPRSRRRRLVLVAARRGGRGEDGRGVGVKRAPPAPAGAVLERLRLRHRPARRPCPPRSPARWSRCSSRRAWRSAKRPGARPARRRAASRRPWRWPRRSSRRRGAALEENEVRLNYPRRTQPYGPRRREGRQRRLDLRRRRRGRPPLKARLDRQAAALDVRPSDRPREAATRRHDHPRAVQRRRDLEGRAARRDDLADLGRRRLHAHRHLHDRRHEVARDRGRRQRELHQPRDSRASTVDGGARRVSRLADSRRT